MFDHAWRAVTEAMTSWYKAKMFIEHASAVSNDALHVLVGMLLWALIAVAFRRTLSASLRWLILLALTLLNECVDLWMEQWPDKAMQLGESAKDVVLTMALPTLLMFLAERAPRLFGDRTSG